MEVSPTGAQTPALMAANVSDPVILLQFLINLQSQTLEMLRQSFELQRQQLDLVRESAQIAREQRARQGADIERWQQAHGPILDACKETLARLEQVHCSLLEELGIYVEDNLENLLEGDFVLSDFVDKFGPRLAHLNTMLGVLRPLAAAQTEGGAKRTDG